jgi:uncharacterized protein (DUF427 family)
MSNQSARDIELNHSRRVALIEFARLFNVIFDGKMVAALSAVAHKTDMWPSGTYKYKSKSISKPNFSACCINVCSFL